eukprot:5560017-Amphidinium_carterae.1
MVYFSAMVLAPQVFEYAPLLLPFAIGNGFVAGAYYLLAERFAGGPEKVAAARLFGWLPIAGPMLGVATALTAPLLYPLCMDLVFPCPDDPFGWSKSAEAAEWARWCVSSPYMAPTFAFTGLAAGLVIQLPLEPVVLGVPGVAWQKVAGCVLAALSIGLGFMYSTSLRANAVHLMEINLDDERYQ